MKVIEIEPNETLVQFLLVLLVQGPSSWLDLVVHIVLEMHAAFRISFVFYHSRSKLHINV